MTTIDKHESRIEALAESNPAVQWLLENGDDVRRSTFLSDVRNKLIRFAALSERQIEAVQRAKDGASQRREDDAKRAALAASGVSAPRGQSTVCGQIVSVKATQYGFGAVVSTDEGWRCWLRLPAALLRECEPLSCKGRRVEFTATLTPSDRDSLFAFAKRPAKAKFLS
jgi:hypothetical protein